MKTKLWKSHFIFSDTYEKRGVPETYIVKVNLEVDYANGKLTIENELNGPFNFLNGYNPDMWIAVGKCITAAAEFGKKQLEENK